MEEKEEKIEQKGSEKVSRREFLKSVGVVVGGAAVGGGVIAGCAP